MKSDFTIVNDGNVRGVLEPADVLSKELLEDMIDFLELSSPASQRKTAERLRSKKWISMEEVHQSVRRST